MTRRSTAVFAAVAVAGSYAALRSPRLEAAEARLAQRLRQPRGATVDTIVGATTDLGSLYALGATAGVLGLAGRSRPALRVTAGGLVAWGVAQALKPVVGRARPYQSADGETHRLVSVPAGSAWPSGHPAVAAAAVAALAPLLPQPALAAGHALALFVAWSRVYVGVHHPTDVVAGVGIGALCGTGAAALLRRR